MEGGLADSSYPHDVYGSRVHPPSVEPIRAGDGSGGNVDRQAGQPGGEIPRNAKAHDLGVGLLLAMRRGSHLEAVHHPEVRTVGRDAQEPLHGRRARHQPYEVVDLGHRLGSCAVAVN